MGIEEERELEVLLEREEEETVGGMFMEEVAGSRVRFLCNSMLEELSRSDRARYSMYHSWMDDE